MVLLLGPSSLGDFVLRSNLNWLSRDYIEYGEYCGPINWAYSHSKDTIYNIADVQFLPTIYQPIVETSKVHVVG